MRRDPLDEDARVAAPLAVLAPSERYDAERGRRYKTLPDWGRQLLLVVRRCFPERAIVAAVDVVAVDSGYAALEFLAACCSWANPVTVVSRLRLDAALYEPAPPREPGQVGRPRCKGRRLPTLATIAADPQTVWTCITIADWYGQGERIVEPASDTAVWYHCGIVVVPLRWVLVRDPKGAYVTQPLLSTDLDARPAQNLAWFVLHWQLEATFEEARRHLGVETQRQ